MYLDFVLTNTNKRVFVHRIKTKICMFIKKNVLNMLHKKQQQQQQNILVQIAPVCLTRFHETGSNHGENEGPS